MPPVEIRSKYAVKTDVIAADGSTLTIVTRLIGRAVMRVQVYRLADSPRPIQGLDMDIVSAAWQKSEKVRRSSAS